jgi:hypothetical protein
MPNMSTYAHTVQSVWQVRLYTAGVSNDRQLFAVATKRVSKKIILKF